MDQNAKNLIAKSVREFFEECFENRGQDADLYSTILKYDVERGLLSQEVYETFKGIADSLGKPGIHVWEYYMEQLNSVLKSYEDTFEIGAPVNA